MENILTKVDVLKGPDVLCYAEDVRNLYLEAGWIKPEDSVAELTGMLQNTPAVACAFNESGHLIGMMRALTDGVSDAYLLDMIVLPAYRRNGAATKILNTLVDSLQKKGIDWIVCISVPGVEELYLRRGTKMTGHTAVRFL